MKRASWLLSIALLVQMLFAASLPAAAQSNGLSPPHPQQISAARRMRTARKRTRAGGAQLPCQTHCAFNALFDCASGAASRSATAENPDGAAAPDNPRSGRRSTGALAGWASSWSSRAPPRLS